MIVFPNAKINLGLRILYKRPDGFHAIETIFYPVGWSDILEIVPSRESRRIRLRLSGLPLQAELQDNLVYRAAAIMQEKYNLPGLRMHLHKQIPAGAGLGGGSSDASFTLKALDRLFSLGLPSRSLHALAKQLGSDCPYFLVNKPVLATGRGDKMTPLSVDLEGNYLLIVYPGFSTATGKMYKNTFPSDQSPGLKEAIGKPHHLWKKYVINRFEETLSLTYPAISSLLNQLYDKGAWYAGVSGSGSSVFGLFKKPPEKLTFPEDYLTWQEKL